MELKFNEAKTVRPNHLERCLCYDKFLKGYRCYVYDDISKYWCTQATTEHDPNGDNHIVDYADYQVTKWASLQQEQPEVGLENIVRIEFGTRAKVEDGRRYVKLDWDNFSILAQHFYNLALVDVRKKALEIGASSVQHPSIELVQFIDNLTK